MLSLGLIGTIILALDILAIWLILHEPWENMKKALWIAIVLFFQVFGMIAYFAFFRTSKIEILPPEK